MKFTVDVNVKDLLSQFPSVPRLTVEKLVQDKVQQIVNEYIDTCTQEELFDLNRQHKFNLTAEQYRQLDHLDDEDLASLFAKYPNFEEAILHWKEYEQSVNDAIKAYQSSPE